MSLSKRMFPIAFLIAFLLAASAFGQSRNPADYSRVLLPFHATAPGVLQGQWRVSWWIHNEGSTAADVFPTGYLGIFVPSGIHDRPAVRPKATLKNAGTDTLPFFFVPPLIPITSAAPGALLFVESARAAELTISGSIGWASQTGLLARRATLEGIPESAFRGGPASILGVNVRPNERYAVRIYALPESVGSAPRVTVRVYEMVKMVGFSQEVLLQQADVDLAIPTYTLDLCTGNCDVPPVTLVPASATVFNVGVGGSTIRVEIEPHSPALRWWAILSATDNVTQDVALTSISR